MLLVPWAQPPLAQQSSSTYHAHPAGPGLPRADPSAAATSVMRCPRAGPGSRRSRPGPTSRRVIRISDLPWRRIASRYSSQSSCSPEMQRKYSTSPSSASCDGMSSTSAVPSTCTHGPSNSSDITSTVAAGLRRRFRAFARSGYVEITSRPPASTPPGHGRDLRPSVLPGRDECVAVPLAGEVEQLLAADLGGRGDRRHARQPRRRRIAGWGRGSVGFIGAHHHSQ